MSLPLQIPVSVDFGLPLLCRLRGIFTHRGIFRQKPLRDGDVVVGNLPWDALSVLRLPEQRVQVGEVVVDVDPIVGPAPQGPASQLRALEMIQNVRIPQAPEQS